MPLRTPVSAEIKDIYQALCEYYPNTEFFLVRIFLYSTQSDSDVFSRNIEKYGLEKTPYLDTFYAVKLIINDFSVVKLILTIN